MSTRDNQQSGRAKDIFHPRNSHRQGYPLNDWLIRYPLLQPFATTNPVGETTIDFFNPEAVRTLNAVILEDTYQIRHFTLPEDYLCPPVPGRADYIHHVADLLAETLGKIPQGPSFRLLDIGTGASAIYGLLAARMYQWKPVMVDTDKPALHNAQLIWEKNKEVLGEGKFLLQQHPHRFLDGSLSKDDFFDVLVCNPPFNGSEEEAQLRADKKFRSLTKDKRQTRVLNFGGQSGELWYPGGEQAFIRGMMTESLRYAGQCYWFTTLVSRQSSLPALYNVLDGVHARRVRTIEMGQGNKRSRVLCWTFFTPEQEKAWRKWKGC